MTEGLTRKSGWSVARLLDLGERVMSDSSHIFDDHDNRWEAEQPPVDREPGDIIADLGTIWSWLPPEVRERDADPEKIGIQKMRAALALLKPRP